MRVQGGHKGLQVLHRLPVELSQQLQCVQVIICESIALIFSIEASCAIYELAGEGLGAFEPRMVPDLVQNLQTTACLPPPPRQGHDQTRAKTNCPSITLPVP